MSRRALLPIAILVGAGTYNEQLTVDKPLQIDGAGCSSSVISWGAE